MTKQTAALPAASVLDWLLRKSLGFHSWTLPVECEASLDFAAVPLCS